MRLALPDGTLDLLTDRGVFSRGDIDPGTKLLLLEAPAPAASGDHLDLGCGYGPIALTLATRRRRLPVWAVDVNDRALALTRTNAAGLGNVSVARPDEVPDDVAFAGIYSNPPIRSGKAALHGLMERWLPRLMPGGRAYLVVHKHLGADSFTTWLRGAGWPTTRLTSVQGYRILEVEPCNSAAPR